MADKAIIDEGKEKVRYYLNFHSNDIFFIHLYVVTENKM